MNKKVVAIVPPLIIWYADPATKFRAIHCMVDAKTSQRALTATLILLNYVIFPAALASSFLFLKDSWSRFLSMKNKGSAMLSPINTAVVCLFHMYLHVRMVEGLFNTALDNNLGILILIVLSGKSYLVYLWLQWWSSAL